MEDDIKMDPAPLSNCKKIVVLIILTSYAIFQLAMPFSHFITKGYNGWTNGLYGYSWDMMVNNWETVMIKVKVVDHYTEQHYFLDPNAWVLTDRWAKHPDMIKQYANCVKEKLETEQGHPMNISLYLDVWCSLNGRLSQRMYKPDVDILTAPWSPFEPVSWALPVLQNLTHWRYRLPQIEEEIFQEDNTTDIIFVADFPGYYLENYISNELDDARLQVLEGKVKVVTDKNETSQLETGEYTVIPTGAFHKVYTISEHPSAYMYVYRNMTGPADRGGKKMYKPLGTALYEEFLKRMAEIKRSIALAYLALAKVADTLLV